ncbi:U-box domain [Legionella busanensis]|uniref:U-box domain n=1 Tax=Legionella busanensis TaxID=190655 RepID=A0A378JPF8_9GAMM|nr:U-box domain-containing protein [Legionella busanensis]STX52079.1 U-box domain [Legionella busanensis]
MLSKPEENKVKNQEPINEHLKVPDYLVCPITKLIFLEPIIVVPSGKCYEKEVIDRLLQEAAKVGKPLLCPLTGIPIKEYVQGYNIESAVEDYLNLYPNASNRQYLREDNKIEDNKAATSDNSEQNNDVQSPSVIEPDISQQITEDTVLARAMQESPPSSKLQRTQEFENHQRLIRSVEALHQQRQREQRTQQRQSTTSNSRQSNYNVLTETEKKAYDVLITDIQNLIYALGFEKGPRPRGKIDNFSRLFFAGIESDFLEPLPWQKIKVAPGPKPQTIYNVLKAAISSLKDMDPRVLENSKAQYKGEYDRVKNILGGQLSLNQNSYDLFAKTMGPIKNQPGYLANQILKQVSEMHECIRSKHIEFKPNQPLSL